MDNPLIVSHPIVADKVRQLRDAATSNADFLRLAGEISRFLAYEAFRTIATSPTTVSTPVVENAPAVAIRDQFVIVPILRAGLGMTPAVQEVLPHHRVCLVGLRRNEETLQADLYLDGLPKDLEGAPVIVCDPMLATGGSLVQVLDMLATRNAGPLTALCLIAAQPGVEVVRAAHPTVQIVAAALDAALTDVGYITPGLGDAGDRLFGPPVR
jgi:uracil phosphoribosyltransferase